MTLLKILGFLHMLPNTLVALLWLAWARGTGQVVPWGVDQGKARCFCWGFRTVHGSRMSEKSWRGLTVGPFIVLNSIRFGTDVKLSASAIDRTIRHEYRHVQQQCWLGILMPVLYVLFSCAIWLWWHARHAYYSNPFERDARRYAGQNVEIDSSRWPDGPRDRWPWW
jgi:hypothetical protein